MTNCQEGIFLYLKDFTNNGDDKYFLYTDGRLNAVSAEEVTSFNGRLITHDYWLIASGLRAAAGALPTNVIDVVEFHRATCESSRNGGTNSFGFLQVLEAFHEGFDRRNFDDIYHRRADFDHDVYQAIASTLAASWKRLRESAERNGEAERYMSIEAPVFNLLWACATRGIRIDQNKLRAYKSAASDEYYLSLKQFAVKFNLPIEIPSLASIEKELSTRGFDAEFGNVDYILQFLPMQDNYGIDLHELKRIHRSRAILTDLPLSRRRAFPIVDVSGTVTSRIVLRNPALQHLARKHRDIITPDDGKRLAYVDFCQYEPAIICALSKDPEMRRLYDCGDLYEQTSIEMFGTADRRKIAKQLFLSFSYGMSLDRLGDAAAANGAERRQAMHFFRQFLVFQEWREHLASEFQKAGEIGTSFGNYLRRRGDQTLSAKERRSCVSQVVQGTASLIFKKTLLELKNRSAVEILLPMHDAVLFQHAADNEVQEVVAIFEDTFNSHFDGALRGKAEAAQFAA